MPLNPLSRLLLIAAFLCACLVPLKGASASSGAYSLIVSKELGARSAKELDGAIICLVINSGMEAEVKRHFRTQRVSFEPRTEPSIDAAINSYQNGNCDVLVDDRHTAASTLANLRSSHNHMILPDKIGNARATSSPPSQSAAPSTATSVAPSCPSGFVFSGTTCVKQAAEPAPTCPSGYTFSGGRCVRATTAPTPPPIRRAAPPVRQAPRVNIALELQRELKRIGCLTGAVDGVWGRGSEAALLRFKNQAGFNHGPLPTQKALDEARRTETGYCQPVRAAPTRTTPKKRTVKKLPTCAMPVYAECEGIADQQCNHHSSDSKYEACFDRAERSCARSKGCQ